VHGSNTNVDEMALLCGGHHVQVEQGHYTLVILDGIPHVIPPAWIDPQQRPVHNTYWQDKQRARDLGRQLALELNTAHNAAAERAPCDHRDTGTTKRRPERPPERPPDTS
jgi:hypothetical protein